ncbi:MAG: Xaa-Pro aminopeptidase [Candidatus Izimaplasma bacterium HR2]|nr:MAG: Xaa-Pro aminopeptidase [Candidatus Izimaplasma bacterium HR2]
MINIYEENRKNLVKLLKKESIVLLDSGKAPHKTTDQFYHYTTQRNFFYLTGLNEENCKLVIIKSKTTVSTLLFIEETTEYMRQWLGERISKKEASKITKVPETKIYYLSQFETIFRSLMTYGRGIGMTPPKYAYFDLYRVTPIKSPYSYEQFKFVFDIYKELKVENLNENLSYLRMFKSDFEISQLQKAIDITKLGLENVMDHLSSRTNEFQLTADFLHQISLEGSSGNSFNTIAASGENATVLHYEDNNGKLEKGNLILFDLGSLYNNYGSDISRTYPLNGKFSDRQKVLYEIVLKANKESIKFLKPGISWKELNDFAKDILIKECKKIGLIKDDSGINKYYYHSIGHFLGLDTHDVGQYDIKLAEGMVITIEPGLYIKEEGIGIRIEDNILITKDGAVNLSKEIIKEVKDIEEYLS